MGWSAGRLGDVQVTRHGPIIGSHTVISSDLRYFPIAS